MIEVEIIKRFQVVSWLIWYYLYTIQNSNNFTFDTWEYYRARVIELEEERNIANKTANYYQTELAKAHEILGRVVHQLSERWDTVNLSKYFPTNNLHNKRTTNNPEAK